MIRALILTIVASIGLIGCTSSPAATTGLPSAVATLGPTAGPPTRRRPTAAPTESPVTSAPGPSGPCIDTGELADTADVVLVVIQGLIADLKLPDVEKARTDAGTAVSGLKRLADFVGPVQPDAAKVFRTAAGELDTATPKFPGGLSLVDQAQADVTAGLTLARAAGCPD